MCAYSHYFSEGDFQSFVVLIPAPFPRKPDRFLTIKISISLYKGNDSNMYNWH